MRRIIVVTLTIPLLFLFNAAPILIAGDSPDTKDVMTELDKTIQRLSASLEIGDLEEASTIVKELDDLCEMVCKPAAAKYSKTEDKEFKKLTKKFDSQVHKLKTSTQQGSSLTIARFDFAQVTQSCKDCHTKFKEK